MFNTLAFRQSAKTASTFAASAAADESAAAEAFLKITATDCDAVRRDTRRVWRDANHGARDARAPLSVSAFFLHNFDFTSSNYTYSRRMSNKKGTLINSGENPSPANF
jgi:hypothetical protein